MYEYLFAKKDRANIDDGELSDFKLLAKGYASLSKGQIDRLVADKDLLEICDDGKA